MNSTHLRCLPPETLWLEPAHFARAKESSDRATDESQRWQAYIAALALFAFEEWIKDKLPAARIQTISSKDTDKNTEVGYLNVEGFRLCILSTEHVLDEVIRLSKSAVEEPELAAHCYVAIEVLEDQQEAVIRGCLRYDELIQQLERTVSSLPDHYLLPLSFLDAEINHLLGYIQYSHPSKVLLPTTTVASSSTVDTAVTYLSQWLKTALSEGWKALDDLANPEANLAWNTRQNGAAAKGGKLINLGIQLNDCPVILLITVVPEAEKIRINVQILPAGKETTLSPGLTVTLRSSTDDVLQAVTARDRDSYIQLRSFKGKPGIRFTVEVSLDEVKVSEAFEL